MRNVVAIPLLVLVVIVQSAIVPAFGILAGYSDLMLVLLAAWSFQEGVTTALHWAFLGSLMVCLVSHLPWVVYLGSYLAVVMLARLLQSRVWQVPLLAMFAVTFLGTVFLHMLTYGYLRFFGHSVSIGDSLGLVTLPSVLLNLVIAVPMFAAMRDLARWVYPSTEPA